MNESVGAPERELFILRQRVVEAEMAREESDRHKERLRDSAASVFAELRIARERIAVLEAHVRRVERENELLAERLPGEIARAETVRDLLAGAQAELVAAHDAANESELLVDSLQLQLLEARAALARARGLDPGNVPARA